MGVFSGTLSYNRFFVEGQALFDLDDREAFIERLAQFATPTLTPESEDEQVSGWAMIENVLDTDFRQEKVFFNEYALFSLRMDSWKLPTALLKAHQIQAELKFLQEQGREKIGRRERNQIKDEVRKQLKRQMLPHLAAYDICWHIDDGLLRFWSLSSRANETFIELFEKTFGLHLVPQTPYTLAERHGFDEEQLAALASLEPQAFATDDL